MIDLIAYLTGKEPEQVCREWHSFWIGWSEMICLSIPARFPMTDHARFEMKNEEHYYQVGRGIGFGMILFVIASLVKWVFL